MSLVRGDIYSGGSVILGKGAKEVFVRTGDGLTHMMIGEPMGDFGWTICGLVVSWGTVPDDSERGSVCRPPPTCFACILENEP